MYGICSSFISRYISIFVSMVYTLGDSCCNPLSLGHLIKTVEKQIPGIYVKSIRIGNNIEVDTLNGFFKNSNKQIDMVCQNLTADENLKAGFNVIGFSQGGQFW